MGGRSAGARSVAGRKTGGGGGGAPKLRVNNAGFSTKEVASLKTYLSGKGKEVELWTSAGGFSSNSRLTVSVIGSSSKIVSAAKAAGLKLVRTSTGVRSGGGKGDRRATQYVFSKGIGNL